MSHDQAVYLINHAGFDDDLNDQAVNHIYLMGFDDMNDQVTNHINLMGFDGDLNDQAINHMGFDDDLNDQAVNPMGFMMVFKKKV
ncbi:hypothetical protein Bpfe_003863 [Biomphalaria pfeifferi]|uniref:Uncharacterized protein n=1 Tax=Biomphalaria pfeifferi TaxID=112525 RepID=A0AAD8C4P1_BIOPF|nr:hypothetical protein Bpfe_003863 [Biomphalaria pfeifferi]